MKINIRVPATTANLGPGFDCLGLALTLWNETTIELAPKGFAVEIEGEGAGDLPFNKDNLIVKAALKVYDYLELQHPKGLQFTCRNNIPLASGLGSSAAAVLTGIIGANVLLDNPLDDEQIIALGTQIEGHPDNIAPALLGGLTITTTAQGWVSTRQMDVPAWRVVVVLPDVALSTEDARKALPKKVPLEDAVFNIGQTVLTVDAFQQGSLRFLKEAMQDKLHQPYRLPLIAGAAEAIKAAQDLGAAAALSGAGPSVIAFGLKDMDQVGNAMTAAFEKKGVKSRLFSLTVERRRAR